MSYLLTQCVGVNDDESRCKNIAIGDSMHCRDHNPQAVRLYVKYKRLSKQTDLLDIDKEFSSVKERIQYLIYCYSSYDRAFKARLKHRKYAISHECYDWGHNKKLEQLRDVLNRIESILLKLNEENSINIEDLESPDSESNSRDSEDIFDNNLVNTLKRNEIKRRKDLDNINEYLNKCIRENKEALVCKKALISAMVKNIHAIFDIEPPPRDSPTEFVFASILLSLLGYLIPMKYFKDHFKPKRCKCTLKNCKAYVVYKISLFEYLGCVPATLEMFTNFKEEVLKEMYHHVLLQTLKIKNLIDDLMSLTHKFENKVFQLQLCLFWDSKQGIYRIAPETISQ